MTHHNASLRAALVVAVALSALAPAAASAYPVQDNGPTEPAQPAVQVVQAPAHDGFDFGDAAIGAAAAVALSIVAVGGGLAITRRRRPDAAPRPARAAARAPRASLDPGSPRTSSRGHGHVPHWHVLRAARRSLDGRSRPRL